MDSRLRWFLVLPALVLSSAASASRLSGQTIAGILFDSLSGKPLRGATVELLPRDGPRRALLRTTSDSAGHYSLSEAPPGTYTLGFSHPLLDSVGLEPVFTRIQVPRTALPGMRFGANLAVPGPARLLGAVCGPRPANDSTGGALIGRLFDATTQTGIEGAAIIAEWNGVAVDGANVNVVPQQVIAQTISQGRYAICGIPRGSMIVMEAARGADTSGVAQTEIPSNGLARQDIFIDVGSVAATDRATVAIGAADSTEPTRHYGQVSGKVVDATTGRAIKDAQLRVAGTPSTAVSNDSGAYLLADAPSGTQMLLVRAIGYSVQQLAVNVRGDAPASLDVRLLNIGNLLDTMRIVGVRSRGGDATGFERRRRIASGIFLDTTDVERYGSNDITRLLEFTVPAATRYAMPGSQGGGYRLLFRHATDLCEPAFFIDGMQWPSFGSSDIDMMVSPDQVYAIEVYPTSTQSPGQFKVSLSHDPCGSVVIWTKNGRPR